MATKAKVSLVEKALKAAKPFAAKEKKNMKRPVLAAALVTQEYVIAMDAYRAIRIRHHEKVEEPHLHFYKKDSRLAGVYTAKDYPNVCNEYIIPNPADAQESFEIDVHEWIEAHKVGLVAAKKWEHKNMTLSGDMLEVKPVKLKTFDKIGFNYKLDKKTPIERITYNCQYMLDALRAFKKYGHNKIKFNFYSNVRPILLTAGDVEIAIMPIIII